MPLVQYSDVISFWTLFALFPAHIAFFELIIDPACSIVFESEKEDEDIMRKPPRNLRKPMFSREIVIINVLQGLGILLVTFGLYYFVIKSGRSDLAARSYVFTMLVLSNLLLIVVNLSWSKNIFQIILTPNNNKTLPVVVVLGLLSLVATLYFPFFANLFHLEPLLLKDFLLIGMAAVLSLAWFEILKLYKFFYFLK
jgi:Ca2+-transporting ATPase